MLCQIALACLYAEERGRVAVVDTDYVHARSFNDRFSHYFESRTRDLVLDTDGIAAEMDRLTVFPRELTGRLNAYTIAWSDAVEYWVDAETGTRLSFDLLTPYDEDILLRHACGGGPASLLALARMRLKGPLVEGLSRRLDAIGAPFSAIHIRHTDYRCDYVSAIEALKPSVTLPLFVATDNAACRDYCREIFGADNIRSFTNLPEECGRPLHQEWCHTSVVTRNAEAILDLMTLALSSRFFKIPLKENVQKAQYSGFSLLAEGLRQHDNLVASLLGLSETSEWILQRAWSWRKAMG